MYPSLCMCVCRAFGDGAGEGIRFTHTCPGRVWQDPIIPLLPATHRGRQLMFLQQRSAKAWCLLYLYKQQLKRRASINTRVEILHINRCNVCPGTRAGSSRLICVSVLINRRPAGSHPGGEPPFR